MSSIPANYLGRVQALRFFAAFAVLVGHLQHEIVTRLMPDVPFRRFTLIDGGFGVDIFFLISGFIMFHIAADEFGRPGAARAFIVRRFLRIAPLYYLATLLVVAMAALLSGAVSGEMSPSHVISSLLFLPHANLDGTMVPLLKLGWTLNFEVYFYTLFAIALLMPRRTGLAALTLSLTGVVAAATLWPGRSLLLDFWGNSIVFEFLGGIVIAVLYAAACAIGSGTPGSRSRRAYCW